MIHIKYYGIDNTPLYASILGTGQPIVMLHGGGPDRQSIIPFAELLKHDYQIIFPDIRGYGESHCTDKSRHTWEQYTNDVISLIDHLGLEKMVISGMGLGSSIAERFAFSYPERVTAVVLISPETLDKEGEGSSKEEIEMMDKCGEVALRDGLEEAWKPFLPHLAPVINSIVREAIPRTNTKSFSAAMAIVHSKRLENPQQLAGILAPTLVIPGNDERHNSFIGNQYKALIANCYLANPIPWNRLNTVNDLASLVVPEIKKFLKPTFNQKGTHIPIYWC